MKIYWKGSGRVVHGDCVLEWTFVNNPGENGYCVSDYKIFSLRTKQELLSTMIMEDAFPPKPFPRVSPCLNIVKS